MSTEPVYGVEISGDLADFGAQLVELKFRRMHPNCTDGEVATAVAAWWSDRRVAPDGDVAGHVRRT